MHLLKQVLFLTVIAASALFISQSGVAAATDYSNLDPNDHAVYVQNVLAVTGLANGQIKVTFIDDSTATYQLFDIDTDNKVVVQQQQASGWLLAVHPYGKKLKLVNPYTGEIVDTLKLSEDQKYNKNSLKQANVRADQDDAIETVITSKSQDKVLLSVVKVKLSDDTLHKKDSVSLSNANVSVGKTKLSSKKIELRDADKAVLVTYQVQTDYELKFNQDSNASDSIEGSWKLYIDWDDNTVQSTTTTHDQMETVELVNTYSDTDSGIYEGLVYDQNGNQIGTYELRGVELDYKVNGYELTITFENGNVFVGTYDEQADLSRVRVDGVLLDDSGTTGTGELVQAVTGENSIVGEWYQYSTSGAAVGHSNITFTGDNDQGTVFIIDEYGYTATGTYTVVNGTMTYTAINADGITSTVVATFFDTETLTGTWSGAGLSGGYAAQKLN